MVHSDSFAVGSRKAIADWDESEGVAIDAQPAFRGSRSSRLLQVEKREARFSTGFCTPRKGLPRRRRQLAGGEAAVSN